MEQSLIPAFYFCHFTIDLGSSPARFDIIRYDQVYSGFDEYIDILVTNKNDGGLDSYSYFSDVNIRQASRLKSNYEDTESNLFVSPNDNSIVDIYVLNLQNSYSPTFIINAELDVYQK